MTCLNKTATIMHLCLYIGTSFLYGHQDVKNVYIYFKSNAKAAWYYQEKDSFYKQIFSPPYKVTLVSSLKNLANPTFIITDEVPRNDKELAFLTSYPKEKLLLFTFEPPLWEERSNNKLLHSYYSKVFTWNDDFIDNIKYFKVRFPWMDPRPMIADRPDFANKKLCVLVGTNLNSQAPKQNYSERKKVIEFFEHKGTSDFDLYGSLWKKSGYACYKGEIPHEPDRRLQKIHILKQYKFDICYENVRGFNGWVSERIFEAFAAGCVPVYSGSTNIEKYVPKNCFIARDDFNDLEELYQFLTTMDRTTYDTYIHNIQMYLKNSHTNRLSTPYYITCIRKVLGIS